MEDDNPSNGLDDDEVKEIQQEISDEGSGEDQEESSSKKKNKKKKKKKKGKKKTKQTKTASTWQPGPGVEDESTGDDVVEN